MTLGELRKATVDLPEDMPVEILFEVTGGAQYQVPVLTAFPMAGVLLLCHEEDYEGHYSRQ